MINREDWIMIKEMRREGCHIRDTANKLGCCGMTDTRALQCKGPVPKRKSGVRKGKLDTLNPTSTAA